MTEKTLAQATFDPKVRRYWLVQWLLVSTAMVFSIPLIPLVAIIVLMVSKRTLDAMSAQLLERKLLVKRGILFKVEKSIPLEKITDVGMTQGPLMRFFGLYRLNFETAGQSGAGALVSMIGIVNAEEFREQILTQKDNIMMTNNPSNAQKAETPSDMQELIDSVKRIESLLERKLNL